MNIRQNKKTWVILAIVIILSIGLYYFFYKNGSISPFQSQSLCPYSSATDIIKYKSGKFPDMTTFPSSCSSLTDADFWPVIPSQTPVYNTYLNLLSESSIVKKFFDTGRNSSGDYVLTQTPSTEQLAFSDEVDKYITAILAGITAVKENLTPTDTALLATVTGILSKFGPDSQIIKDNGTLAEYVKTLPITYNNRTSEQILMAILDNFKAFEIAPGCDDQFTVLDITSNYDNILDFTYVLKLLYGIVKTNYIAKGVPGLTFAQLKAATDAYTVIKAYYVNPMNAFTGYNKDSYATEDAYMAAIITNINNDIIKNISSDGKIKTTATMPTNMAQDILYTRLEIFTNKCSSISGKTACYTTDVKAMCDKLNYIFKYTGSIESIDVAGYSLPTVPAAGTTTTAAGTTTTATGTTTTTATGTTTTTATGTTTTTATGTTTTSANGTTTTTAAGGTTTTTAAGGTTTTTAAGGTTTTAAGGTTTTTAAGGTTTTAASGTTTTAASGTTTTAASGTTTTTTTPMIFDLASQLDYQKFLDDLSVLFTGRIGDPSEVVNTLLNLNQEQRNSICSTYCNGLYAECTDICKLAKCENCTGGVDNTLTGAGRPSTSGGYSNYTASYNLLDNISDNQFGLGAAGTGGTSSHVGPMLYQKDGDGINNIFAPYVLVQPGTDSSGSGYSAFLLNNPNDPLYKAYLSKLMTDYQNAQ